MLFFFTDFALNIISTMSLNLTPIYKSLAKPNCLLLTYIYNSQKNHISPHCTH